MTETAATNYDRVDYGGNAQSLTAPNHLGAVARMLGLPAASPSRARVLELGCGNAINLTALAWYWPDSEFVGIDLAQRPIDQGRQRVRQLGLVNLDLRQGDVCQLDPSTLGEFDYVIAHGLYSWVPEPVRQACLSLIARVLAPDGVAYVSYNAYPGCRLRHVARELMQFHLGEHPASIEVAERAHALLESVAVLPTDGAPEFFSSVLHDEARRAAATRLNFLFHDDLASINQPYHLHEFCARATHAGLAFLGDAETSLMFEPEGMDALSTWLDAQSAGDWMRRQQYLDFVLGTRFRRTLLCHPRANLRPAQDPSALAGLRFWSEYRPGPGCVIADDSETELHTERGLTARTNNSVLKLLFTMLAQAESRTVCIDDIVPRLSGPPAQIREGLQMMLARLIRNGLVRPLIEPPPGAAAAPAVGLQNPQPLSALSRLWLDEGLSLVDNLHQNLHFGDPWSVGLLERIDGSLDTAQIQALFDRLRAERPDATFAADTEIRVDGLLSTLARGGYCGGRPGR